MPFAAFWIFHVVFFVVFITWARERSKGVFVTTPEVPDKGVYDLITNQGIIIFTTLGFVIPATTFPSYSIILIYTAIFAALYYTSSKYHALRQDQETGLMLLSLRLDGEDVNKVIDEIIDHASAATQKDLRKMHKENKS